MIWILFLIKQKIRMSVSNANVVFNKRNEILSDRRDYYASNQISTSDL